ncbi:polysaccharide pyruvyl transferase family protein [Marinilabiliaceae bacterium JC017]|nr:polysaccharide pyruvyl transferase family protein [Marinilabiliaceae bacterium JC017]
MHLTNKIRLKKAAIITILDNQNIGTYLQAYALVATLRKNNISSKVINYQRKTRSPLSIAKHIWKTKKGCLGAVASIVYRIPIFFIVKKKCRRFLESKVPFTTPYSSYEELKNNPPKADIYITGSDQVWNSVHNRGFDSVFYLKFIESSAAKYSYGSSIGMARIPANEKKLMKDSLEEYRLISTRESSAKKLLGEIGINNVETVLDPTLLLSKEEWSLIAKENGFKKKEPYLLIYSVESERKELIKKIAFEIAKQRGLKVYSITSDWFREGFGGDKSFYLSGPEIFINLFMNADFAVVSSFHGTAFSVNFNIPFLSITPGRFNSRIKSLLKIVDLESKIISDVEFALNEAEKSIDFNKVNVILGEKRKESLLFLDKF